MSFVSSAYLDHLSLDELAQLCRTHINIGYHPETHDNLFVTDTDRESGLYLLGVQGCLHPDTPVFDPVDGTTLTVLERYVKGEAFNVLALDGQNVVIAKADAPLRYTKAPMYELSDGVNSIRVTGYHRVWDGSRYVECRLLYKSQGSSAVLLPTIEADDLSRLQRDAQRWTGTGADSRGSYPSSRHFRDRLPQWDSNTVQSAEESMSYLYCPLPLYSNKSLYRITRVEDEVYYDFHVPKYENYYACGLFHHNSGKSSLLQNLIAADIAAGRAVIALDPHGDSITACLAQLPDYAVPNAYLLDMEDEAYPFGVNLFSHGKLDTDVARTQAINSLMHIFEVLWPDVLSQQHLPRYVRAATITFLANQGATLLDMHHFLTDSAVRYAMLQNVTDPTVRQFWQSQYEDLSAAEQNRRVQPLIGRLESLFMGRSLVRNIVGQRQTTIDFRQAIENKEIIFIRLPVKTIAQDARLIGTLLVAEIHRAIFSFGNMPPEKRPGVSLYIDEFAHFSTTDTAELFSEGRKFGVRLTVAHQYRNQLPGFLRDSTMTAYTKICFQLTPEDSREIAHLFPAPSEGVRPEDITDSACRELLSRPPQVPTLEAFVELYLRPVQQHKRGHRVEIDQFRYDWISGQRLDNRRVPEPTAYLDGLFYQVMLTGNPDLDIPPEIPVGFSNCAGGFYAAARWLRHGTPVLSARVAYPEALILTGPDGSGQVLRAPADEQERLYVFIFCLRQVMRYLAEHPIGKVHQSSISDVSRMLVQLPRRSAFVRSGTVVGVVYTHDTPPRVSDAETAERVSFVRQQTRAKYCSPRQTVEQELAQPPAAASAPDVAGTVPVSLWQELEP